MAIRPLRGRNRARNLALPFVVTAATACTVKTGPQPTTPAADPEAQESNGRPDPRGAAPTQGGTANAGDDSNVRTISNPPPPNSEEEKPVGVVGNPPPPQPDLPPAPTSGGTLQRNEDGTCTFYYSVDCPPNTMCNPPPPQQVQCPAGDAGEQ